MAKDKENKDSNTRRCCATVAAAHYLHGRLEQQIESFASQYDLPSDELVSRVGLLLAGDFLAEHTVALHRVDLEEELQQKAAEAFQEFFQSQHAAKKVAKKAAKKEEKAAKKPHLVAKTKASSSAGNKDYWAKLSPLQRKREVARRKKVSVAKKAAAA
jgi:hypothetical protein